MKKAIAIIVLGLLLSGNAYAELEHLPKGTTVNSLLKDGYRLFSTETVGIPDTYGEDGRQSIGFFGSIYHLIKGKELVTCQLSEGIVICIKP
jgi:hypothetical protein|tara:strand:- start:74 stop:349 length:276 start_codon:yes stop_codon:yes gene_type:complete